MIEGELARAGIQGLDTETVITKDLRALFDFTIEGGLEVAGDVSIGGNLLLAGALTGTIEGLYYLQPGVVLDCTGANTYYLVVPSDGGGRIAGVSWVVTTGFTGAACRINITAEGEAVIGTQVAPAGVAGANGRTDFPVGTPNCTVQAGDNIKIDVAITDASGFARIVVEISR